MLSAPSGGGEEAIDAASGGCCPSARLAIAGSKLNALVNSGAARTLMAEETFKGRVASIVIFGAICSANNSYLDYLFNSVARNSRVQIIVLKVHTTAQIRPAHAWGPP